MFPFIGKQTTKALNDIEVTVQVIDFSDKRVLFIKRNGEVDTTFDVKAPDSHTFYELKTLGEPLSDFICDKKCLIGNSTDLRLSILVNHLAKLLYTLNETRNLIITISSRLFDSKGSDNDLDIILGVLSVVKNVI
jgi:hypothetical protein